MAGAGTTLANYAWTYDPLGRVHTFTSLNDSNDTAGYFYDPTDQLIGITHIVLTTEDRNFGYDPAGNRTDGGYVTPSGSNNQLQTDGRFQYGYDPEGNLTSRLRLATNTDPNDPYKTLYFWDHRNRLTAVEFWDSDSHLAKRVEYVYDVYDRRIGKQVDSNGNGIFDRAERFVYDQGRDLLFAFLDSDGDGSAFASSLATRYLNGAHVDQVLAEEWLDAMPGQAEDVYWSLADNLGTNRDVVHRVGGATQSVEHLNFDSFGQILTDTNSAFTQRQTYAGLEYDADVGLYYAHHRWFDATTHRFISEDPIEADENLYRYVRNNPHQLIDPAGLAGENIAAAEGRVAGEAIKELLLRSANVQTEVRVIRLINGREVPGKVDVGACTDGGIRNLPAEIGPASTTGVPAKLSQAGALADGANIILYEQTGTVPQSGGSVRFVELTFRQAQQLNRGAASNNWSSSQIFREAAKMATVQAAPVSDTAAQAGGAFYRRGVRITPTTPRSSPRAGAGGVKAMSGSLMLLSVIQEPFHVFVNSCENGTGFIEEYSKYLNEAWRRAEAYRHIGPSLLMFGPGAEVDPVTRQVIF